MRLEEVFKNLGFIAATVGAQIKHGMAQGVPLEDLDLTAPAPHELSLSGPAQVVLTEGEVFRIDVQEGVDSQEVRFQLDAARLSVAGGDGDTVVRVTLPSVSKLTLAGSGRVTADKLARDGEVSIAGSGRLEVAQVGGGKLSVSLAGSGRLFADGAADRLDLSIAGSGSCDAEGLTVESAAVHIAGSGDAIFACSGTVDASLMGSGNVIVRGSARCNVRSVGSGTLTCERDRESAD